MGDLLRADGGVRSGPPHPPAPADPALQTQRPLRRDHGRVLARPPPHQVTERNWTGEQAGGQRAEPVHSCGEGGEGRPAPTGDTQL